MMPISGGTESSLKNPVRSRSAAPRRCGCARNGASKTFAFTRGIFPCRKTKVWSCFAAGCNDLRHEIRRRIREPREAPIIQSAPKSFQKGFTLLEVLLVLSIIGLAGALLVPRLGGLDGRSFNVEVRSAANLLNHARRNAVVTGNPATISFLPGDEDGELDYSPPIFSAGVFNARNIELQFLDSTGLQEPVLEPLEITFFPEGGSTGGALLLLRDDRSASIHVDPFTGRMETAYESE